MLYFHRLYIFRLQSYCFFLTYAREKAILCVFCLSVISALRSSMFALRTRAAHLLLECPLDTLRCALTASRSSLGHRSVGKRQRMGGYKQGQGTHKTIQNGQKVIWSVIYINLTRLYINFCFRKVLYISDLHESNINRGIWI